MTVDFRFLKDPKQDICYLDALISLEEKAVQTQSAPFTMPHDREFFEANLSGGAQNILVFADQQLIGYSCYRAMQPWPPYLDPLPYPPELCVMLVYSLLDTEWRGKGIGRELNQRRMAAVREQGFRYVFATVHPEHQVNMDIQLSMGLEVIAQKKMFSHQLMRNLLFMAL